MKFIIVAMGLVAVMGVAVTYIPSVTEVNKIETEEVIKEILPEWGSDEEAVEAAKAVIQRKAWESELEALEASFGSSTATYEAEKEVYLEQKKELEKSLGLY
jgi:hypothetical protein